MIVHPKLPLDHGGDTLEGPALRGKAGCHGASVQEPTDSPRDAYADRAREVTPVRAPWPRPER